MSENPNVALTSEQIGTARDNDGVVGKVTEGSNPVRFGHQFILIVVLWADDGVLKTKLNAAE